MFTAREILIQEMEALSKAMGNPLREGEHKRLRGFSNVKLVEEAQILSCAAEAFLRRRAFENMGKMSTGADELKKCVQLMREIEETI